jgi:hypothetical protein
VIVSSWARRSTPGSIDIEPRIAVDFFSERPAQIAQSDAL